jgi:cell division cycle 14
LATFSSKFVWKGCEKHVDVYDENHLAIGIFLELSFSLVTMTMPTRKCTMQGNMENAFARDVFDNVCIAQNIEYFQTTRKFRCFRPQAVVEYLPFRDDFGPMNFETSLRFIALLDEEIERFSPRKIVYCVDDGRRSLANAIYLLGAYMLMKFEMTSSDIVARFDWVNEKLVEPFRDAAPDLPDFGLTLADCWSGLEQARNLGWIKLSTSGDLQGKIDLGKYMHFDNPANGNMHQVVPGKFVALPGPQDAPSEHIEGVCTHPRDYVDALRQHNVTTIIRLNEAEYSSEEFTELGFAFHHLECPDRTAPPPETAAAFLAAAEAAPGVVAVHCTSGLGRTGTLIALYMMKHHGFSPRAAMGWLRVMRPGSVIGDQQHYLCSPSAQRDIGRGDAGAAEICGGRGAAAAAAAHEGVLRALRAGFGPARAGRLAATIPCRILAERRGSSCSRSPSSSPPPSPSLRPISFAVGGWELTNAAR